MSSFQDLGVLFTIILRQGPKGVTHMLSQSCNSTLPQWTCLGVLPQGYIEKTTSSVLIVIIN